MLKLSLDKEDVVKIIEEVTFNLIGREFNPTGHSNNQNYLKKTLKHKET